MSGKAPESAELKAVVEAFSQLSAEDQTLFRGKVFVKLCNGLSKEKREFLARLEQEKKKAAQLESVAALSTEELEAILAARKKKK